MFGRAAGSTVPGRVTTLRKESRAVLLSVSPVVSRSRRCRGSCVAAAGSTARESVGASPAGGLVAELGKYLAARAVVSTFVLPRTSIEVGDNSALGLAVVACFGSSALSWRVPGVARVFASRRVRQSWGRVSARAVAMTFRAHLACSAVVDAVRCSRREVGGSRDSAALPAPTRDAAMRAIRR